MRALRVVLICMRTSLRDAGPHRPLLHRRRGDRVRAVLQPVSAKSLAPAQNLAPYTHISSFYRIANAMDGKPKPRGRTPESLVLRQMKIFKEQWAGMGMSLDLGLCGETSWGRVGHAGLRTRAPRATTCPSASGGRVNLAGGKVEKIEKLEKSGGLEAEERRDDGSGVHDYPPAEADKYVAYPELMAASVEYIRRELVRLERIPNEVFLGQGVIGTESYGLEPLRFGSVRSAHGLVAVLAREQQ
ncbi:hypothetical protein TRAPUB_9879 [Trametes pubescens]|uniref:Uncharacterized protein n=1 Tax=Trametes pubescens TaxID=154538 RepID=A0A1M2W1A5_TRAPU|nr:hypothetical protein TRAPUB_9879 [Trametes pubescens]